MRNLPFPNDTAFWTLVAITNAILNAPFSVASEGPILPNIWPILSRNYLSKRVFLVTNGLPIISPQLWEILGNLAFRGDTAFWTPLTCAPFLSPSEGPILPNISSVLSRNYLEKRAIVGDKWIAQDPPRNFWGGRGQSAIFWRYRISNYNFDLKCHTFCTILASFWGSYFAQHFVNS